MRAALGLLGLLASAGLLLSGCHSQQHYQHYQLHGQTLPKAWLDQIEPQITRRDWVERHLGPPHARSEAHGLVHYDYRIIASEVTTEREYLVRTERQIDRQPVTLRVSFRDDVVVNVLGLRPPERPPVQEHPVQPHTKAEPASASPSAAEPAIAESPERAAADSASEPLVPMVPQDNPATTAYPAGSDPEPVPAPRAEDLLSAENPASEHAASAEAVPGAAGSAELAPKGQAPEDQAPEGQAPEDQAPEDQAPEDQAPED